MARPLVPDTTAFISVFRHPELWPALERPLRAGRVWLSSVVVAELLAGTRDVAEARHVDRLVSAMREIPPDGRILTPTPREWAMAGRLLARRSRLYGAVEPRNHLADVLILLSAARIGAEIQTANLRHFQAWERLARAGGLDVVVAGV
ncbi:MAG: PIN domain-containing protein [Chloroflexi bacterium]|nr:PIN domain-containing protein [Chloroflexota bacterium]